MSDKARKMTDGELFLVHPYLQDRLEREMERVSGWEDDPITVHYGVASEISGLVYARVNKVEDALHDIEFELECRAIKAWPQESEADRRRRRFYHLNPLPPEYRAFSDYYNEFYEPPVGWDADKMYDLYRSHYEDSLQYQLDRIALGE